MFPLFPFQFCFLPQTLSVVITSLSQIGSKGIKCEILPIPLLCAFIYVHKIHIPEVLPIKDLRTSLLVQWLRLHTPIAGGLGSIPGWGTRSHMAQLKSLHAATKNQSSQINKNIKMNILKHCLVKCIFRCVVIIDLG